MNEARREEINKFTDSLRSNLHITSPIELEKIIEGLGGTLEETTKLPEHIEAMIYRIENSFKIEVHKNFPPTRKRFSIAHEIGHLFLHMGYLVNPQKWAATGEYADSAFLRHGHSLEETEANEFAASLLMPKAEFLEIAQQNLNDNYYDLPPIAQYFNVSLDSVRYRGRWLGLFAWK